MTTTMNFETISPVSGSLIDALKLVFFSTDIKETLDVMGTFFGRRCPDHTEIVGLTEHYEVHDFFEALDRNNVCVVIFKADRQSETVKEKVKTFFAISGLPEYLGNGKRLISLLTFPLAKNKRIMDKYG